MLSLMAVALVAVLVGTSTFALFSSYATNSQNSFTAGTLDIALDKEDPNGGAYFNVADMAPGDAEIRPVIVSNVGTLPLEYTMSLTVGGDLGTLDQNHLIIVGYPTQTDADSDSNPIDLTQLRYLDAQGGTNDSETIYVKVTLPLAAGDIYQNKSGTANITVNAQQIVGVDFTNLSWQTTGHGTATATPVSNGGIAFNYDYGAGYNYTHEQWTFKTKAQKTEVITFDWNYTGLHSWFNAQAKATLFIEGPTGTVTKELVNSSVYDTFNYSGQETITVNAGYNYGIIINGYNFDSSQILRGTFTMTPIN